MSNVFWKNFYLCFSNFKCTPITLPPPPHHHSPQTLITNFNSLYNSLSSTTTTTTTTTSSSSSSSTDHRRSSTDSLPPDFATVFASQRFFFSYPGSSNSILDSPGSSPSPVTGGVAIQTYSPDPYSDFRRSMQEMVESRELTDLKADWEFLHELLMCYLTLNPKSTHKFIFSAFSDLIISLISFDGCRENEDRRHCSVQRRSV
ncbi:hypothetical protein LguiA_001530 [Lonicera macranthoides]